MKKILLFTLPVVLAGCADLFGIEEGNDYVTEGKGYLVVNFERNLIPTSSTKGSARAIPDTNDFILTISDNNGAAMYKGKFGAAPQSLALDAGTYFVDIVSCEFNSPLFDCPQYGDSQTVVVKSGQTSTVKLACSQINSGMRLILEQSFTKEFPDGELYIKTAEGTLMFGYDETRTAYFKPGNVTLSLDSDGSVKNLLTRSVEAREILRLRLSAASGSGRSGRITVALDTSRVWNNENFTVGDTDASNIADAYSVSEAKQHIGSKSVWVYGYIVGGDLTSSKFSYTYPFISRTNIVIASRSACTDKSQCLSIQLNKGDLRDELNLVDNASNLGRQVYLKGDIVAAYYGIPGMENLTDLSWK